MARVLVMVMSIALAAGCAPATVIRRTALINAPMAPAREGQPLDKGDVRLEGHFNGNLAGDEGDFYVFVPNVAEVGNPGVLVPSVTLGASVWAGLPAGLEIGGQLYFAAMEWAGPNVAGVLPFPRGEEENLWMGGLGLRWNIDTANPRLSLALLGEVNVATIAEAIFVCTDERRCSNELVFTDFEGRDLYTFDRVEHETFFLPNLALSIGWRFGDFDGAPRPIGPDGVVVERDPQLLVASVMPFVSLGMQSSVTNTGFETDLGTLPSDSLEALWVGYVSFGFEALLDKFVIGVSGLIPFDGEDAIDFGLCYNVRIGAQL